MKAYVYVFVFTYCATLLSLGVPKSTVDLTSVACSQGEITTTFTCYFSQRPLCIYEPQPDRDARVAQQTVVFFVPLASISTSCQTKLARMMSDSSSGITLSIKTVTKPLRGITLTFKYDAQKKSWDHALLDTNTDTHGIVVKFHDKQALSHINQRSSPLRWYAQGKHQPRIVLDATCGGYDRGHLYTSQSREKDITFSYAQALGKSLSARGFEVFCTRHADVFVSPDARSTYANMVCHADLLVSFAASCTYLNGAVAVTIEQPALQVHSSTATMQEQQQLKSLSLSLHKRSQSVARCIHESLKSSCVKYNCILQSGLDERTVLLFQGLEIPAVQVQLGKLGSSPRYQPEIVENLSNTLQHCLNEKNNKIYNASL